MLAATIVLALGLLVRGGGSIEDEYLFGGRTLGEHEVDSVELAFSQAGLKSWTREGRRIKIPVETRSDYLAALQASSTLPLELRSSIQTAIDKSTAFESNEQRVAREMHAKEQTWAAKSPRFLKSVGRASSTIAANGLGCHANAPSRPAWWFHLKGTSR